MDIESERQEDLSEAREGLASADGESLETRFGPGSFGYHELLDRASILVDNWDSFIASHPSTLLDPDRYRKAREIAQAMADFYQLVGRGDVSISTDAVVPGG